MSSAWVLVSVLGILLLVVMYFVFRTSERVGDYSWQSEQRYELPSSQYGRQAYEDWLFEDGAKSQTKHSAYAIASDTKSSFSETSVHVPPPNEVDQLPTEIRRIFVNGEKLYDGEGVNKVTIRISIPGDAQQRKALVAMHTDSYVPTKGLIINAEPLEKILSGRKTLELRKKNNNTRGPVALIQKGSGRIVGVATIGDSVGPMTFSDFTARIHEHGVEPHRLSQVFDDGYVVGWHLSEVKRLRTPVPYVHKAGAVTWVTLDSTDQHALQAAMDSV